MEIKDLLPIGSVVRLKGGKRYVMIYGVMAGSYGKPDVVKDYISVPYPEGHLDPRLHIGFNHEDIEEVVFRGYEDPNEDRKKFLATLEIMTKVKEMRTSQAASSETPTQG